MPELKRVAYLTAGAAGMYCGSCMNDNSLARALQQRTVDCVLVPVYTPIRVDHDDVSGSRVFLGGVNIYLDQTIPLYGRLPQWMVRWLDSPWLLRSVTRWAVGINAEQLGSLTESMLAGELGNQRRETIELARWLGREIRPQVVVLTNLLIGGCIPELKRTTGAPVVVMLQGDDLFIEHLPEPSRQRCLNKLRELVRQVDMFLVNTDFYGSKMAAMLEIPPGKMRKVPLGLEPFSTLGRKATTQEKTAPRIGYMARLAPEKGLHVLVDAFIHMHAQQLSPEAELHIAGWLGTQHEPYAQQQWSKLELAGLASKFTYHGSPDFERKVALLRSFDVLSVPTTYDEPKGLFVLEAFAAGVPVVLPNRGAFPEILADCGGGYLVDADDSRVLAECLANLLSDRASAKKLGQQGFAGLQSKRTIQQIAATFQSVLTELVG